MKKLFLILCTLATCSAFATTAPTFPELYCVSAKSFQNVNQINIFTNKKGTMRISLQFWATDGQEAGSFDTATLQTITKLKFDPATNTISNGAGKLSFMLGTQPVTPAQAEKLMQQSENTYDLENPSGHKIDFKKYYLATMTVYNLPGNRGHWDASLMQAFKAGVNHYVCGKFEDTIGRRPTIFDDLGDSGAED